MESGIVEIHGREYKTVALRIQEFRKDHPFWTIKTKVTSAAELVTVTAKIYDEGMRLKATGHSEENRGDGHINKTAAVENAETSAVGRALAFLGYGGMHIASADEMDAKQEAQEKERVINWVKMHNGLIRDYWDIISNIKDQIADENLEAAREYLAEIPHDVQQKIWVAPTKGGIFTTKEREFLKIGESK